MSFSNTDSVVASDLNNMVRGLYRDNTTHTVTATTAETDMGSLSITGGTIGATGGIHVIAGGFLTAPGSGSKAMKLYLGSQLIATVSRSASNLQDWVIEAWCFNTAANAQRWTVYFSTTDAETVSMDYTLSTIDTASSQTLKLTGTLSNGGDSITQAFFDVFQVQVT
jgi:hypothetical protein